MQDEQSDQAGTTAHDARDLAETAALAIIALKGRPKPEAPRLASIVDKAMIGLERPVDRASLLARVIPRLVQLLA